jgi:hypothetical protein
MATIAVHVPRSGDANPPKQKTEDLDRFKRLLEDDDDENKSGTDEDDNIVVSDDPDDVEVIDDTPNEDVGKDVASLDSSYEDEDKAIEAELKQLQGNKGLAKRIPVVIKQRNDERRAKEEANRARIEATNFARQMHERAQYLEKILNDTGKLSIAQMQESARIKLESARQGLKDANESGDSEAITKAQEAMSRAINDEAAAKTATLPRLPEAPRPPAVSSLDPKTQGWVNKNAWFTKNRTLTSAALEFSEEAMKKGLTPQDDSYYSYVDEKMKPLLSAYGLAPDPSSGKDDPPRKKPTENVTPVSRAAAASSPQRADPSKNKVTLTKAQAQLAVELMPHVPVNEALRRYAKELRKTQA